MNNNYHIAIAQGVPIDQSRKTLERMAVFMGTPTIDTNGCNKALFELKPGYFVQVVIVSNN